MSRKIEEEAERAKLPHGSILKSAREPNGCDRLLTARDAADLLRLSTSWLAKTRGQGNGPPFLKIGRTVRYSEGALVQWLKSHQRLSTSAQ